MNIGSTLVNGETITSISVFDRSLQFGDGLFETIAMVAGIPCLWDRHLQRLTKSCNRLNIPTPAADLLLAEVMAVSAGYTQCVVKLLISRGSSERGYSYSDQLAPNRLLYCSAWPRAALQRRDPMRLHTCATRLGLNPGLAGIKHTGRLEQVLAKAELVDKQDTEGLMLDINDRVIEGTASNIFLDVDGDLHTPSLRSSGIHGVVRGLVEDTAKLQGNSVVERDIAVDDLYSATAVYLTSSLLGIVPVGVFGEKVWAASSWNNPIISAAQQRVFCP